MTTTEEVIYHPAISFAIEEYPGTEYDPALVLRIIDPLDNEVMCTMRFESPEHYAEMHQTMAAWQPVIDVLDTDGFDAAARASGREVITIFNEDDFDDIGDMFG